MWAKGGGGGGGGLISGVKWGAIATMKDNGEILVSDSGPQVDVLQEEFKQAGVLPNGWYDLAFNQEKRRMLWAGQSPDGRKWDENFPEGQPARPWNGASDTRVPLVDGVCNDGTAIRCAAFDKADLHASAMDVDQADLAGAAKKYLHWLVHTKHRRMLRLEVELSAQYMQEHAWCVAYVGWERELAKRRRTVSLEHLMEAGMAMQGAGDATGNSQSPMADSQGGGAVNPMALLLAQIMDPGLEEEAVAGVMGLYASYVTQSLASRGFDEEEAAGLTGLSTASARGVVRALREGKEAVLPVPYVAKNGPTVWVLTPYLEFLAARGTMMLQQARAVFWRRWMTEAELASKVADGWDAQWVEAVKKTKGAIASWAGALGATSLTGPSTKTVGNTTYLKVTEMNNPLCEVVYAFRKQVDEDGVVAVWQTIFSPHLTHDEAGAPDFCAKHEILDYAHGRYPFVELKRENLGRALIDSRSVAEVAGTWQDQQKTQLDMLADRSQWDTLPPVRVTGLGGVDYKLGPGAQVPMKRQDVIEALNLKAGPPTLSLELIQGIRAMTNEYFGLPSAESNPGKLAAQQMKAVGDFYSFWGEVLMHVFALDLQYNPQQVAKISGSAELAQLDPFEVWDAFVFGLAFDVAELNPDYLLQKFEALHTQVLPADAGGVIDRAALTNLELRMLDPHLAAKVTLDKGAASQQIFRDVDLQVARMALGNEAEYTENDATAPAKLQFLQSVIQANPKYQQWLSKDPRFQELLANFAKNLQMSVDQQQNKQVGRLGVKPVGT